MADSAQPGRELVPRQHVVTTEHPVPGPDEPDEPGFDPQLVSRLAATGRSMFGLAARGEVFHPRGPVDDAEAQQLLGVGPKQLGSAGTSASRGQQRAS